MLKGKSESVSASDLQLLWKNHLILLDAQDDSYPTVVSDEEDLDHRCNK